MVMESLNRRDFLKRALGTGAVAVLNSVIPQTVEAGEKSYKFLSSRMTPEVLESQKQKAIDSLVASIPLDERVAYLRENARNLSHESQMYIPSPVELQDVVSKSEPALQELADSIAPGSYGLFVFADSDENSNRFQRLYVLKKTDDGKSVEFVKGYLVSAASEGFGNAPNSNQTPLRMHRVHSGRQGLFGEVVSGLNKHKDLFNRIILNGIDHWFVKGFGGRSDGNDIAEVVTDQYLLHGKTTSPERGIRIHGTNRSGEFDENGNWKTFLGGRTRSGGCIRMSNTDVRDLGLSGYIWSPASEKNTRTKNQGTPVSIFATPEAIQRVGKFSEEEMRHRPPRWKPPATTSEPEKSETTVAKPPAPSTATKRPPRWKPK